MGLHLGEIDDKIRLAHRPDDVKPAADFSPQLLHRGRLQAVVQLHPREGVHAAGGVDAPQPPLHIGAAGAVRQGDVLDAPLPEPVYHRLDKEGVGGHRLFRLPGRQEVGL